MVEVSGVGKEKRGENQGGAAPGAPCDMGTEAKVRDNLANWNDRAALHAASAFYGVDALVENPEVVSGVARRDLEVLAPHLPGGSVEGLSLLHLQCHIGTDTLSWRRMGADPVWGLDFSPASLAQARSIAARADAPLTLEQIEAYTAQDESPWPRFSWDLLVPPGLILLALIWLIRFIRRHRKKRIKAPKIKPIKKKYLR